MNHLIYIFLITLTCTFFSCEKKQVPSLLYAIEENGLYGYIDSTGKRIIEPQFIYAQPVASNNLALVIVDTIYSECVDSSAFKNEGKKIQKRPCIIARYGYINYQGNFEIAPKLHACGFLDKEDIGKLDFNVVNWFDTFIFSNGYAVCQDTLTWLYGYIDKDGNKRIPAIYENAKPFRQGRAVVAKYTGKTIGVDWLKRKTHLGVIDKENKVIVPFEYYDINNYSSGYTIGRKWEKSKEEGVQEVLTRDEQGMFHIENQDFSKSLNDICVILNRDGHIVDSLSSLFQYYAFCNGICVVYNSFTSKLSNIDTFHFMDTLGNTLEPMGRIEGQQVEELFKSEQAFYVMPEDAEIMGCTRFENNLAGISLNNKVWAFVDKNLIFRGKGLDDTYEYIKPFTDGIAAVKKNGKWGYVNTSLRIIIPCKYDSCDYNNIGFLSKVYNYKKDSTIAMYVNRNDSIVWSNTKLSGHENKYSNPYCKKNAKDYGKWIYKEANDDITLRTILIISSFLILIITLIFAIKHFKKGRQQ